MTASNDGRSRAFCIFLLAGALLSLEVAFTRIFSFIMFHHFTYLAISTAMLGFGAAGSYLTTRKTNNNFSAGNEFIARSACLLGLTTIAAVVFIPRIHFYPMDLYYHHDYSNLLSLMVILVLAATPFFFGGTCIAYIISRAGKGINSIYFADLTGAASGCLLVILLINWLGGIATCFAVAAVGMLVAAISSVYRRKRYLIGAVVTLALTGVVAQTECLPMYVPSSKAMFGKEHLVELVKWHVITRLDVTRPEESYYSFAGALSHKYKGEPQKVSLIYQDAAAWTGIIQPTPTPQETKSLGYYLQGAAYKIKPEAESFVIGCGGGVDILIAQYYGARQIVGVDINPHMIKLISEEYSDFAGHAYEGNDVELIVSEGRHYLSREQRKFDVIQLSGVDTFSALSTGAYALSENFIYTAEAMDQYLAHLKEDGIINISRGFFTPPRETLKLVATWVEALERTGAEQPYNHMMILSGKGQGSSMSWAQTLVKRSPFSKDEVETLRSWTESLGFDVNYDPYTERGNELETIIHLSPKERSQFIAGHRLNIQPATDDRPFFFQFYRWGDLLRMDLKGGGGVRPPLALLILLGSFGIVTILSGVFIIYPLYRQGTCAKHGGRAGIFIYFASLGLGFIMVEIALLQKLTVFLGGPTYSMSITLFTILLASGIGSFLSRHWSGRPFRVLRVVIPLLVVVIIGESLLLDYMIPKLMYLSHFLRGVATVALIGPLGLLMGIPFPAGLRHVDQSRSELNSWAWGINACATVMGTIVCIMVSTLFGFRAALVSGAAVYLVGWLFFTISQHGVITKPVALD
ncbi:MAG: class I SAM-dependent methyltransferase [Sedimentisphaerales bacterium]|nr:class I SAM-dependent methyltransferase [Sedimentisphaerales bacterium]